MIMALVHASELTNKETTNYHSTTRQSIRGSAIYTQPHNTKVTTAAIIIKSVWLNKEFCFTLNFTILHICNPTFDPASFHACSVSAAAFLTWVRERKQIMHAMNPYVADSTAKQYRQLTFRSKSDPNNSKLLSFQSYFLALTRPDMTTHTRLNRTTTNTSQERERQHRPRAVDVFPY